MLLLTESNGTGPAGLVTELWSVCCLPALGLLCCQSLCSSSLGHQRATGVQPKTSQGTLGGCTLQEDNFLQIRIDEVRNRVVSGITQSNLKYESISQLETVLMSCFSFVLHCAYYFTWKINRQINPSAQPRLEEQAPVQNAKSWRKKEAGYRARARGRPLSQVSRNISSLPLGHISPKDLGKGTSCLSLRSVAFQ